MMERTYSHKSDGRQSSAGQSVHSATSGRANSLGIDTPFSGLGTSPMELPGFNPGLLVLGSVPSIIRCWLNDNFKHNSLLYAAVCTGSHGSYLDERLITQLGYTKQVRDDVDRRIKLPVYFPEATTRGTSASRPSSPTPQLPSITIDFTVMTSSLDESDRSIQIFIGSDVLRAHNADVLFSTNSITLYDDDRCKLSIPMVRPEDDQNFRNLRLTALPLSSSQSTSRSVPLQQSSPPNGLRQTATNESSPMGSPAQRRSPRTLSEDHALAPSVAGETILEPTGPSPGSQPSMVTFEAKTRTEPSLLPTVPRSASTSSTIWGSWRRDADSKPPLSNDSWAKAGSSYQRREQGIKVLRPTKPASRTVSTTTTGPTSPTSATPQSRFFTDGSRRASVENASSMAIPDARDKSKDVSTLGSAGGVKLKSANPVGGGSAFSWLSK